MCINALTKDTFLFSPTCSFGIGISRLIGQEDEPLELNPSNV
ncbi:14722_t:CDS:2, partial [Cetraspora pellucida]